MASLLLAALYLLDQRDIKRLLAYSSVEHMGILAIGVCFGAPIALAGVLLHVLAHAAAKGNAFMGAGVFTIKYSSKRMSAMRGGLGLLPWSGPLFLLAVSPCRRCRRSASSAASSRLSPAGWPRQRRGRGRAGHPGHGGFLGLRSATRILTRPARPAGRRAVTGRDAAGDAHTASRGRRPAAVAHVSPAARPSGALGRASQMTGQASRAPGW